AHGRPLGRPFGPQEHGEEFLLVMIVHLDLGNVGAGRGDEMNDRIRQPPVIRPNSGDDDLHALTALKRFEIEAWFKRRLHAGHLGWRRWPKNGHFASLCTTWQCYDTFSLLALCGVSIPRGALSTVTLRHRQTAKFHLAALDISVNCTAVRP